MTRPRDAVVSGPHGSAVPRLMVLTDRAQSMAAGRELVDTVAAAVGAGAPAILFREKDLPRDERRELAVRLQAVTRGHGARFLVASDARLAQEAGATGVHLAVGDPALGPDERHGLLVGRSCHDGDEIAAAVAEDVDYVTISPVAPTGSKPGHGPPLGPDGLAELAAATGDVAVLALGGIAPDNVARFCADGADGVDGVAVMGAVMRAADPAAVVSKLLAALPEEHTS